MGIILILSCMADFANSFIFPRYLTCISSCLVDIVNHIYFTDISLHTFLMFLIIYISSCLTDVVNPSTFTDIYSCLVDIANLYTYRYFFLCGRWFAIEEDDGSLDRILPVAGRDEILTFNHLFFDKARRKLFDDHLWISLVGRPSRSNFTRLQRLTCILCLLFTTMVTNAMFYGQEKVSCQYP